MGFVLVQIPVEDEGYGFSVRADVNFLYFDSDIRIGFFIKGI